jgi:hypothetical protein
MALSRGARNPKCLGCLGQRQPCEEVNLHQLGLHWFLNGEFGQRLVKSQQVFARGFTRDVRPKIDSLAAATPLEATLTASVFHENAAHGLGRGCKEMAAVVPRPSVFSSYQPDVRFMNQCGGVERLSGALTNEFLGGKSSKFIVHQRQKLLGRLNFTTLQSFENPGNHAHSDEYTAILVSNAIGRTLARNLTRFPHSAADLVATALSVGHIDRGNISTRLQPTRKPDLANRSLVGQLN